jgi:O-6-methylguanine DNA methyltransferase
MGGRFEGEELLVKYMVYNTGTPAGTIYMASFNEEILRIENNYDAFFKSIERYGKVQRDESGILVEAKNQLKLYFAKKLRVFKLPLYIDGTPFNMSLWNELMKIPYGKTTTYGKISKDIGKPKAAQAVGRAVGLNPIPFIIPCHRVIGKDGSLTGFRLGLDVKKFLLNLEAEKSYLNE